jgi:hypothetical protein
VEAIPSSTQTTHRRSSSDRSMRLSSATDVLPTCWCLSYGSTQCRHTDAIPHTCNQRNTNDKQCRATAPCTKECEARVKDTIEGVL